MKHGYNDKAMGDEIAQSGLSNEADVVKKFNNWENDADAKALISAMGYDISSVTKVSATLLTGSFKSDIRVNIDGNFNYIQVKLVRSNKGFSQADKRWLHTYKSWWNLPDDVFRALQYYTGDSKPYKKSQLKDRMLFKELSDEERSAILRWFSDNKRVIIEKILKGKDDSPPKWILVVKKVGETTNYAIKSVDDVVKYFAKGKVEFTRVNTLQIGKVTMQRKGGDAGRRTAKKIQFKIDPALLFDREKM